MRVEKHWHRLAREVVYDPSLETFQVTLDRDSEQHDLVEDGPAHCYRELDQMTLEGPFDDSIIL